MFSNIGSLLDRLQGLLSKAFLLCGLVPFILLFFINWGMVYYLFPEKYLDWRTVLIPSNDAPLDFWIKMVLVIFVGSLIIWNLNPWLRQFWEGKFFPEWLRRIFCGQLSKKFLELQHKREKQALELSKYRGFSGDLEESLAVARKKGSDKPPSDISPLLVEKFNELKDRHRSYNTILFDKVKEVFDLLVEDLGNKSADQTKGLDKIHVSFIKIVREIISGNESAYDKLLTDTRQRFPDSLGRVGPTTMANFAEAHRDYGLNRYGIDIERFWLHLLKIIREDEHFYPMLEESKNQLDFSIAITSVFSITTLIWVPVSLFMGDSAIIFAMVSLLGPLIVIVSYQIAVQSYRGFSAVVQAAIDLNRFKLFGAFHLKEPENSADELALWKELSKSKPSLDFNEKDPIQETPPPNLNKWERFKKWIGLK